MRNDWAAYWLGVILLIGERPALAGFSTFEGGDTMHIPLSEVGICAGDLVAGFGGALISLLCVPPMRPCRLVSTILANMASAGYLAPLVVWYGDIPKALEVGVAFILGVTAMHLMHVGFVWLDRFRDDPLSIINKLRGKQ